MKTYISNEWWRKLESILTEMEIPYSVDFDSHVSDDLKTITYDKYIHINPIIIQYEKKTEEL